MDQRSGNSQPPSEQSDVLVLLIGLARHRVLIGLVTAVLVVIGVVSAVVSGPSYSAQSRFVPQRSAAGQRGLLSLGAQLGIALPSMSSDGESLEFYAELVRAPGILKEVVQTEFPDPTNPARTATLLNIYEIEGKPRFDAMQRAVRRLRQDITVNSVTRTGIVTVTATAPTRELAIRINERLLGLLNEFNMQKRQTQAAAERRFVEARAADAQSQLRKAEAELTRFHEQNRRIEGSAQLRARAADLDRRVNLLQEVYVSLAQNVEQARINEVRNTPVITVIDSPGDWVERTDRSVIQTALLWCILGLSLGVTVALILIRAEVNRAQNPGLWNELRQTVKLKRLTAV